jgi:dipeptidyl aminopeptidase/acylaminoacyl peptidase
MGVSVKRFVSVAVAALAGFVPQLVVAETAEEAAVLFGARESVLDVSLSPSGTKLLYIAPARPAGEAVYVADLSTGAPPKMISAYNNPDSELTGCDWATDERLICRVRYIDSLNGALIGATRMYAMSADGSDPIMLSAREGDGAIGFSQDGGSIIALDLPDRPNKILMTREFVPEYRTGTLVGGDSEGLGVEEVDVVTGRRRQVEAPNEANTSFVADDKGAVRLRVRQFSDNDGYLKGKRRYDVHAAAGGAWTTLAELQDENDAAFRPVSVDAARNLAYGFVDRNGYDAVATMALDGTGASEIVLARDDVDVDSLIRIGRQQRIVGVSYATEKREIAYLDPALKRLTEQFQRALPGHPLINIVGASADENQLLLVASRDTDPGMVYFFDKGSRQLKTVFPLRPELTGRAMGQMTPIIFPAADGTQIPGYLTLPPGSDGKNLPAIVLPHGGPSARDEWGFDWLVQFFVARGYAVLQPNYRGSAGYGTAWFGRNGFQAWRTAVGDVNDAGRWLAAQGIAGPQRLAIVGWSYGGYAALQSQVLDANLYKAVVAIAPVTDLEQLREDSRPYTSYRLVDRFVGQGEHVAAGSPARNADAFSAPVLLFHGTRDQNVAAAQSRLMQARLKERGKSVRYVEYENRDHYIDDSEARTGMLVEIDKFLSDALGG